MNILHFFVTALCALCWALPVQAQETVNSPPPPETAAPKPVSSAGAFAQNGANPEISITIDAAGAHSNFTDETAQRLSLPGFLEQSSRDGKQQGLQFNYFEMAYRASVDPYFDFMGVITLESGEIDAEEAYVGTRQFPWGLALRIGKFLSSFGRLNGQHKHLWNFYDAPLVYEVFTGGEGIKNPGVRLSWTAPLDFLLELHAEVFQGTFDDSPTFDTKGYTLTAANGALLSKGNAAAPGLYVASLKTSFDFGNNVFLLGASAMRGHTTLTSIQGQPNDSAFTANGTLLYDVELTYKYLLSSYRSIAWQTEYLGRNSSGALALAVDGKTRVLDKQQGGLYSEIVWRFDDPGRWRVGARYDLLTQNTVSLDGVDQANPAMLPRYAGMLEYSPTEFSRLRLQYNYNHARFLDGVRKDAQEIMLQANFSMGPHGAHSF